MTAPATAQTVAEPTQRPLDALQIATYALGAVAAARTMQLAVRAALLRDVVRLWPMLDKTRLGETFPAWLRAMQMLLTNYHGQSAQAAATSYRAARAAALQSPTPAGLVKLAAPPSEEWMARALSYSSLGMLSKDTARPGTALSTTLGTASRIVLDGGRQTTEQTVRSDPAAAGWFLRTDGDPCWWCAMIASRGVVYKEHSLDRSNARFTGPGTARMHNHCGCTLAPAFSRDQPLPEVNDTADQVWRENAAMHSGEKARKAFRTAWESRDTSGS